WLTCSIGAIRFERGCRNCAGACYGLRVTAYGVLQSMVKSVKESLLISSKSQFAPFLNDET
ncbi:MAG: hypothetical protein ACOVQM_06365, partial [Pirellula sp.]